MKESIETIVCWASLLLGVILCLTVGWLLMRAVRRGKIGRFRATVIQGGAILPLGVVPVISALGARWLASLFGLALFSRDGGNDGNLVGVGVMGMIVTFGAAVLFAAVMLFQALTGSGSSDFDDKE